MKIRKTKFLGVPIGTLVVLVIAGITISGVLVISEWYGTMTGDVDLDGQYPESEILLDGVMIDSETTVMPMDITSMFAGDSESYPHTIEVTSSFCRGDYVMVSWDASAVTSFTEEHEFFGFYFDIDVDDVDVTNDPLFLVPGDPATTFDFNYELDPLFAQTESDLPFDLLCTMVATANLAPVVPEHQTLLIPGDTTTVYTLDDLGVSDDIHGDLLEITDAHLTGGADGLSVAIGADGQSLEFTANGPFANGGEFTVTDELGVFSTGTITCNEA